MRVGPRVAGSRKWANAAGEVGKITGLAFVDGEQAVAEAAEFGEATLRVR